MTVLQANETMIANNFTSRLPFFGKSCYEVYEINSGNNSNSITPTHVDVTDVAKASWIIIITLCIILLNLLMIVVLHSRRHSQFLQPQPRILMTSLACTDLAVGILVAPMAVYPTLYHCWPYGVAMCRVEALLISALFHQSTLSLVIIAVERYISILHPLRYASIVTKKVCLCTILASWLFSFFVYSLVIYPSSNSYFDARGLMSCEPYYANKTIILVAACLFYIPPAITICFCYAAIFIVVRKQKNAVELVAFTVSGKLHVRHSTNMQRIEKMKTRASLTLALIGIVYLLAVTPWTLTELLSSCFAVVVPQWLEFTVRWIAISNSVWNPIIYGIMSHTFRDIALGIFRQCFSLERRIC